MSNFDPRSPSYVPPGGQLLEAGDAFAYAEGNQTATALLAANTLLAASTAVAVTGNQCKGALFVLAVDAVPASASTTIALKINIIDPVSTRTATFASRAAVSASGVAVLMVYPGVSASAGGQSSPLPKSFSVQLSVSSAAANNTSTLSLSMFRIA